MYFALLNHAQEKRTMPELEYHSSNFNTASTCVLKVSNGLTCIIPSIRGIFRVSGFEPMTLYNNYNNNVDHELVEVQMSSHWYGVDVSRGEVPAQMSASLLDH
ncbi:hypothetical protein TNCV_1444771 [Trichonephila clavipes]|nr:hypothetical protein TNCV_1444771 [Trichonephila clavipes]